MLGVLLEISTTPAAETSAADFTSLFVRMLIVLIVVCAAAVVVLKFLVPRMGLFKRFSSGRYIEIIARQGLEQKKFLYIVKIGSRYALVGTSDHGVNLLMELKREDVD